MKFITEDFLRDLYRKEPFTIFNLDPEERLTPGARQFLTDRGIKLTNQKTKGSVSSGSADNWQDLKLRSRLKSLEALFFLTKEEILQRDVFLAQKVAGLNRHFSLIRKKVKGKEKLESLECIPCSGINEKNFSDNLEDCFEITEFHMSVEKGKEILLLHRLRCALQEIEPFILETWEGSKGEIDRYLELIARVNEINNSLSQLICATLGGKKCQRKI